MRDKYLMWGAAILICAITLFFGYVVWKDAKSEKISLNKSDWTCTKTETQVNNIVAGKVIVPQITEHCVRYERN